MTPSGCPTDLLAKERRVELSQGERRVLELHLAQCASCRTWQQLGRDFDADAQARPEDAATLVYMARQMRHQLPNLPRARKHGHRSSFARLRPHLLPRLRPRMWFAITALGLLASAVAAGAIGIGLQTRPPEVDPQWVRSARAVSNRDVPATTSAALEPRTLAPPSQVAPGLLEPRASLPDSLDVARQASPDRSTVLPPSRVHAATPRHDEATQSKPTTPLADSPLELYREANTARRARRGAEAIELFTQLQARYPRSQEAQLSQVPFGNALLDRGLAQAALQKFDQYLSTGNSALAAEALYGRARALSIVGTLGEKRRSWQRLLDAYPRSPYASTAKRKLDSLR